MTSFLIILVLMTFLLTSMHLDGIKILLIFGKLRNCNLWDEAGKSRRLNHVNSI